MYTWPLDRQGFVTHYMVSGPLVTPFSSDVRDKNQLRYEAYLRSVVAEHTPVADATRVSAGENSRLGLPWRFQGGSDGAFVNLSDFYATMQRVAFDAATVLIAPKDMTVQAVLWGYTAVDVYCNGENIGGLTQPIDIPAQTGVGVVDLHHQGLIPSRHGISQEAPLRRRHRLRRETGAACRRSTGNRPVSVMATGWMVK